MVLGFAKAIGEFGATILFAGSLQGRTQTMPLLIYGAIERDIDGPKSEPVRIEDHEPRFGSVQACRRVTPRAATRRPKRRA